MVAQHSSSPLCLERSIIIMGDICLNMYPGRHFSKETFLRKSHLCGCSVLLKIEYTLEGIVFAAFIVLPISTQIVTSKTKRLEIIIAFVKTI